MHLHMVSNGIQREAHRQRKCGACAAGEATDERVGDIAWYFVHRHCTRLVPPGSFKNKIKKWKKWIATTRSSAEALLFVNMGDDALDAKNAEAVLFANMGDNALNAKSVEALLFVNMGDNAIDAKSA